MAVLMVDPFSDWYNQLVDVATLQTVDFSGVQTTVSNTDVPVGVEDATEWIADSNSGEARPVSKIFAALSDRAKFTVGSAVTLPDGRVATVRSVSVDVGDPDLDGITVKVA